jgi:FkbM family methyltransferase
VPPSQTISYAQRYEDLHLMRCFGAQAAGFYIDIGAGHPVYDNVSFAFYLRGWRGITVEPNPWLAQLSDAVRPRDTRIRSLIGAVEGEATYYLVEDFHGLSTTVERHARAAHSEFGKRSRAMTMPVTTLRTVCERHAPEAIDFLKVDVEGAERTVIEGGDWRRFRPKVLVLEALAPVTMAPSWEAFEPLIVSHGYRFAFFDSLNRYYVADEHGGLAARIADAPDAFPEAVQLSAFKPALDDPAHPDHSLAVLLAGTDMMRVPLLPPDEVAERLTAGLDAEGLARPATRADLAAVHQRLFGRLPPPGWAATLALQPDASVRDLYRCAVLTDTFRAACGRISASYAW